MTRLEEGAAMARLFMEAITHRAGIEVTPVDIVASAMLAVLNAYDLSHQHHVEPDVASVYDATLRAAWWRGQHPDNIGLRRCVITLCDVAREHSTAVKDIQGESRASAIVRVRDAVAWACRQDGHPYALIGVALGGRDHSTVMAAVSRHEGGLTAPVDGRAAV